jgi:hypothetical protein
MTPVQHLQLYGALKGLSGAGLARSVDTLLSQVGLAEKRATAAAALSGGQKRKLCLAVSLTGASTTIFLVPGPAARTVEDVQGPRTPGGSPVLGPFAHRRRTSPPRAWTRTRAARSGRCSARTARAGRSCSPRTFSTRRSCSRTASPSWPRARCAET